MDKYKVNPDSVPQIIKVEAGQDRFGEYRGLGISAISFKIVPSDSDGILILENTFTGKGGPPRHLHYEQDEWFYVLEGEFIIEIGKDIFNLNPGDSILAPRKIPHVWAHTDSGRGRILITFMPAGRMEAFFRIVNRADAMPPQDPSLWKDHGMELAGPPLAIK